MLDHQSIHVCHVERTIGTCLDLSRAKPVVCRCQEFGILFLITPLAGEAQSLRPHDFAMNQIVNRLTDEYLCLISFRKEIVAIDHRRTGRSKSVEGVKIVESSQRAAGGKNRCRAGCDRDVFLQGWRDQKRISPQIVIVKQVMPNGSAVVVSKPVTPVIAVSTELRLARNRFHFARIRPDPHITSANIDGIHFFYRNRSRQCRNNSNRSTTVTVRQIEPVV